MAVLSQYRKCSISISALARFLGVSMGKIIRKISKFEKKQVFTVTRVCGKSNIYKFLFPNED